MVTTWALDGVFWRINSVQNAGNKVNTLHWARLGVKGQQDKKGYIESLLSKADSPACWHYCSVLTVSQPPRSMVAHTARVHFKRFGPIYKLVCTSVFQWVSVPVWRLPVSKTVCFIQTLGAMFVNRITERDAFFIKKMHFKLAYACRCRGRARRPRLASNKVISVRSRGFLRPTFSYANKQKKMSLASPSHPHIRPPPGYYRRLPRGDACLHTGTPRLASPGLCFNI